jgi:hypothetical protein
MSGLLIDYIRLALRETRLARVPQQLQPVPREDGTEEDGNDEENVQEFSGIASVAGYTGPLGMSPDKLGRKKNRPRRKQ